MEWLHPFWALALPTVLSIPIGRWMARVLDPPADRAGQGADTLALGLFRALGRREPAPMNARRYAFALLGFNLALFLASFTLLWLQPMLPFNPDGKGTLTALGPEGTDTGVIFNTACSFVTNTNLQHYSGEQHLSYFSQIGVLVWLQFVTPACGLAAMIAVARGLRGDEHLGDFYLDMIRAVALVLIPFSVIVGLALVACGVPMTFSGAVEAATLEGTTQTIARGPVAALVAIKQVGTNGGGFFGPNSTHPFENPSAWSNLIEVTAIPLLPMASIVMLGAMLRNHRHAAVLYGVMLAFVVAGVTLALLEETRPNEAAAGLPITSSANLEGKELRIGAKAAATWAALTTATSNGSVNGMIDSFRPLAGLVAMALMMLNVAFSGIGAGFLNMLMYVLVAVFIAGLMVGRTPEYLGKKVEAGEVKLAMIALLIHPLLICAGTAIFASSDFGAKTVANPGPHGFGEILYEFSSAAANNGSGFEGLGDNTPAWNLATGSVLLLGRFPALVLPLLIAGSLSRKTRVPETTGTLRTDDLTFALMLLGTIVLVGALSFMPAVVLGPVADQLTSAR